jgi:hypothetical protein
LEGREFDEFVADIKTNGLHEPIWIYQGEILDGRNRYRACIAGGVEVRTREYTGDSPVAFVWSLNGARRQLNKSQLAMIAVKMLEPLKAEAKKRQGARTDLNIPTVPEGSGESGEAVAQAAALVGLGATSVYQAKAVIDRAPELAKQVESGKISVDKAHKIMKRDGTPPDPNAKSQPRKKRIEDIRRLANEGNRALQIAAELGIGVERVRLIAREESITLPDAMIGKVPRLNARRIVEETVTALSGHAMGLQLVQTITDVSSTEAKEWADSLYSSIKSVSRLRKQLLEIANG